MENMDYMINEMTAALQAMDSEILAGGILFPAGIFAAMMARQQHRHRPDFLPRHHRPDPGPGQG